MIDDAVSRETVSRRTFLKSSAASGSAIFLGVNVEKATALFAPAATSHEEAVRILAPSPATVLPSFLAAKLKWEYAGGEAPHNIILTVATSRDPEYPVVHVTLAGTTTTCALPLVPNENYVWQLQPTDADGRPTVAKARGSFKMGTIRIVQDAPPEEMYKNPRRGAHYSPFKPISFGVDEPLSPWYDVKEYTMAPPPKFAEVKDQLPCPVFEGHPDALETYWYCWKTLLDVWYYAPYHANHQAVANINGYPTWAGWGSAQVWDSFCQMYYAKYGHQVYPFITQFDNAYARQHENGFICQESDNDNFEVYACHPALCPFLIGRAEWNYYLVSGDLDRLRRVFTPLVKNYEWFMTYMRRESDGIYGFVTPGTRDTCGTDTFDFAFPATALRAVETLAMARIAAVIGRPDMASFFTNEHRRLGDYINEHFWDSEHHLYNDRCDPNHLWPPFRDPELAGEFVTEVKEGLLYKPSWTFVPLLAEIAPPERVQALVRLGQDPNGFNRPDGIGHDSVDSTPQGYLTDNESGPGSIWPPIPQIVQEGFQAAGEWSVARVDAEKYFKAVVDAYIKGKTIRESLDSTTTEFRGQPQFVGWGGVAPIGTFIEYVLGIDVNTPEKTIVWHLQRTERHGLQHLKVGDFYVDLLCDKRSAADATCRLTVTSEGAFTLQTVVGEEVVHHRIQKGTVTLRVA
jgi:Trehalase